MANLNFQQPPRSLSNQGLSRGGFGSTSLPGHVTPTSGIFPTSGSGGGSSGGGSGSAGSGGGSSTSSSFAPQQLSPNRGLMGNRALFGHRGGFPERRQVGLGSVLSDWSSSSMGSMANFGMASAQSRNYGGSQGLGANFHSVFSASGSGGAGAGDSSTPPLLDMSEFPSLTNRGGQNDSLPQSSTLPAGKQPYGVCVREMRWMGMVKQPMSESSEFTMSSEDFPALPGTSSDGNSTNSGGGVGAVGSGSSGSGGVSTSGGVSVGGGSSSVSGATVANSVGAPGPIGTGIDKISSSSVEDRGSTGGGDSTTPNNIGAVGSSRSSQSHDLLSSKQPVKKGIQTSPDGKVTNIPNSMVKDQFGMVGLLTFIRAAETDPNLVSLALGQDLTALGLNLNSPDNLYPTFAGPWAETPCRPQDIDYNVPPEYIIHHNIRDKLASIKLSRYKEDLLFFLFYTSAGDILQLAAAAELYNREWRYHIEEKVWITQAPGCSVVEKTSTYERGTYYFFDPQNWRKVAKEFYLDYSKLESQPTIPAAYHGAV